MNRKSVQKVSKRFTGEDAAKTRSFGKTDARYWRSRLFRSAYTRGDERREAAGWCMKIKHAGRREVLNLRTSNQAAAAQKAADIYRQLVGDGWGGVLQQWKPKVVPAEKAASVGEFIKAVCAVSSARPLSVWNYGVSLRLIVADVAGIPRNDPSKWDYRGRGSSRWREKVDALPLSILTPEKVQAWRLARLRSVGENPARLRATKTTINTTIRKAKSLFSAKVLKFVGGGLVLPPNPFAGVEFFPRCSMRYVSKINAPAMIEAARTELGGDPEKVELWKAFVLLMFAGLRKNEADKLRWDSVCFTLGVLRIEDHEHFQAKCEASKGSVELDAEVIAMMRVWRAQDAGGVFVLRSEIAPLMKARHFHYRAKRTFDALAAWLRGHGITAQKTLHELRKEAGSLVAEKHGIYAASRFLRHADITITSAHYVDKKQRVTVGLGGLLSSPDADAGRGEHVFTPPASEAVNITPFPALVKLAGSTNTKRKSA